MKSDPLSKDSHPELIEKYWSVITIIFIASLMLTISLMIPRGLDLTDEALYILNAKFPHSLDFGSSYYHVFTSFLWKISGSLIGFRFIGLAIVLTAGIFIAVTVWTMLERNQRTWRRLVFLASISGIFSLVNGTLLNYSPSYNQLVLLFGSIAFAATFAQTLMANTSTKLLYWLIFDVSMILVLLSKPTAFFPLWLLCFYLRLSSSVARKRLVGYEIMNLVFCGLSVCFLFNVWLKGFLDFPQLERGLEVLRELQKLSPLGVLLQNVKNSILGLIITIGFSLVTFFAINADLKVLQKFSRQAQFLCVYASIIFLSLGWLGGSDRWKSQSISLHLALLVLFFLVFTKTQVTKMEYVQYLALLLFPYMLSVGTNNLYFSQILFYCSSWGLLIALFAIKLSSIEKYSRSTLGVCILICTTILVQQATYLARNSYGLLQPLILNSKTVAIDGLGMLSVDSESMKMLEDANKSRDLCNLDGNEILISASGIGGLNLILDLQPAGAAWIQGIQTLSFVSENAIKTRHREVLWAFRASDSRLRIDFTSRYPTIKLEKCAQISLGTREIIELWRQG